MTRYRTEKDSMGELQVPENALYGAQTQRAVENFPISGLTLPRDFIATVALIKYCAAQVNNELKLLDGKRAKAIRKAAREVRDGKWDGHFPVDVFQTGSGTSTNMNVNEVVARLAGEYSGVEVSPNDHVNMSQSSNDVIPTAIHVSAVLALQKELLPALSHLEKTVRKKAAKVRAVVKTGRTHLMDAMPVTLEQEMTAWASQLKKGRERLEAVMPHLCQLAQGGTAVGTGINAPEKFAGRFCEVLGKATGLTFSPAESLFETIATQDTAVSLSGQLKTVGVSLTKISNDLRWMNSGPLAGLGEISLPALQPGSSIMPGKVNPVIPEAVAMVGAQVTGNDAAIAAAGQSGNFQLNVMLPVIAHNLLQSIHLLSNASRVLADRAVATFTVNEDKVREALDRNPILVTALNPRVGYLKAAEIAKRAYAEKRPVIDVAAEMTDLPRDELRKLLDPAALTRGGLTEG